MLINSVLTLLLIVLSNMRIMKEGKDIFPYNAIYMVSDCISMYHYFSNWFFFLKVIKPLEVFNLFITHMPIYALRNSISN